ncbi:hypothetical protein [Cohnella laeviribosi]|uniref:hypothetical protein n=1 Tax=Cohnella laeviribosi TaxID=380174 RepID=UPI0003A64817|nr:hypothetical protein [Cohnella laeviribosi]
MHGSSTPLVKWMTAFRLVSNTAKGINAVRLQAAIGVTYKTAFAMLRKIRRVLVQSNEREPLTGHVKGGLRYYGRYLNISPEANGKLQPIVVAASFSSGWNWRPAQIKMNHISKAYLPNGYLLKIGIQDYAERYVHPDAKSVFVGRGRMLLNRIRPLPELFADAKRWINRTFRGLGPRYLQTYLDEYCFRLHLVLRKEPIFMRLVAVCMRTCCPSAFAQPVAPFYKLGC